MARGIDTPCIIPKAICILETHKMGVTFIKFMRSQDTLELLKHPNEYTLFSLIAYRAKRTEKLNIFNLKLGEALIGDHNSCGLTRQKYRSALNNLINWNLIKIRTTNKGTIAKIINSDIFDINEEISNHQGNHQGNHQITSNQPTNNHQPTTNNNDKNVNNDKNIFNKDSIEYRLSEYLKKWVLKNNPKARVPENLNKWARSFNEIIRIDKRDPEQIKNVIKWCQSDSFWFKNILSPSKLRKQYDRLLLEIKGRPKQRDSRFDNL